ncbi:hypothetical protein PR003_g8377 [Phytophthora rubi]|nr:hypothetical protein PF011_g28002 [Phytophthora fragariae]KAE9344623.1 hypothetical protein PR003_g8377 [Phytophthora rubi]
MCATQNQDVSAQLTKKGNTGTTASLDNATDAGVFLSRAEQEHFIRKTSHILFMTEYVVLTEYAEVVVPILYGTNLATP